MRDFSTGSLLRNNYQKKRDYVSGITLNTQDGILGWRCQRKAEDNFTYGNGKIIIGSFSDQKQKQINKTVCIQLQLSSGFAQ